MNKLTKLSFCLPVFWLLLFLITPFFIILKLSFSQMIFGVPPYAPLVEFQDYVITFLLNLNNYRTIFMDSFYAYAFLYSIKIAAISTIITLFLGYPMAYYIARLPTYNQIILLTLIILPSWTSFLLRVYAWLGILQNTGFLNQFLMSLQIIENPIQFLYTDFAVYLGIVYAYLPFMVLPIYVAISKLDWALHNAAADLGASPFRIFRSITIPLTFQGIFTGCLLVFIPAVGEFVIPDLLGGSGSNMIGRILWQEFFSNRDWPLSAALTMIMLLLLLVPIYLFVRYAKTD